MSRGFATVMTLGVFACGVKAPPLPPLPAGETRVERLSVHARRVKGEWWVRAALPRFARFTVTRRAADCPEGRLLLATDGTTREVEVREAASGRQRFVVVAITATGERFEKAIEVEEKPK